uniref:ADF-H domain-containing protein n=1 Tax=Alexandrium catenella TaxID=2925 RepID=A0A7S1MGN3_ALECA
MASGGGAADGGLFRRDGGVKVSSGLDVSDPGIAEAWAKVRTDSDAETWMLLEYEGKSKLKVRASGAGGAEELLASITDDQILFGGLRTKAGKFICLMCMGEDAGAMARGRAAAHKNAAVNALDGTIGEVCGKNKEEFSENLAKVEF